LLDVVAAEGPVARERAARLVAERCGVTRMTQQFVAQVLASLAVLEEAQRPREHDGFLWPRARGIPARSSARADRRSAGRRR
jgi:hypothetical protein